MGISNALLDCAQSSTSPSVTARNPDSQMSGTAIVLQAYDGSKQLIARKDFTMSVTTAAINSCTGKKIGSSMN